jgi:hypothetical protein
VSGYVDLVEWALAQGSFIPPAEMFALIDGVRAGRTTLTARERDLLATLAAVMKSSAPGFLADLVKAIATHVDETTRVGVDELLTIKAFVMTVNGVAEQDIAAGNPIEGAHYRAMGQVVKSIELGVLATAEAKGTPS